jgi:hypothetical protein
MPKPLKKQKKQQEINVINPSQKEKQHGEDLLPCIEGQEIRNSWQPTLDPHVYISFSVKQLDRAHGDQDLVKEMIAQERFTDCHPIVTATLKQLLEEEVRNRTGFPIKYLPASASKDFMRDRNVVFIGEYGGRSQEELYKIKKSAATLDFRRPEYRQEKPAQFKVIFLLPINPSDITNLDKRSFLHEFAHAVFTEKHFEPINKRDHGPFCRGPKKQEPSLDCKDTIMAYEDFCLPVIKITNEINLELQAMGKSGRVSRFDPDPAIRQLFRKQEDAFPPTLGWLDLLAANKSKTKWLASCEQLGQTPISATISAFEPETGEFSHNRHLLAVDDPLVTSSASPRYDFSSPWIVVFKFGQSTFSSYQQPEILISTSADIHDVSLPKLTTSSRDLEETQKTLAGQIMLVGATIQMINYCYRWLTSSDQRQAVLSASDKPSATAKTATIVSDDKLKESVKSLSTTLDELEQQIAKVPEKSRQSFRWTQFGLAEYRDMLKNLSEKSGVRSKVLENLNRDIQQLKREVTIQLAAKNKLIKIAANPEMEAGFFSGQAPFSPKVTTPALEKSTPTVMRSQ